MASAAIMQTIRAVLAKEVRLERPAESIAGDADLFDLGLDSHGAVRVMLALEDRLGVEFPEDRLSRSTFSSVDAIAAAIGTAGPTG